MTTRLGTVLSAVVLFTVIASNNAFSHVSEKLLPVRLVVAEWAIAYQSDNIEDMNALLAEDFNGHPAAKASYLARLPALPVKKVILRYANYQIEGNEASVSSIVHIPYKQMYVPYSINMKLRKQGDDWKITSLVETDDVPEEMDRINHPSQNILHELKGSLRDKKSGELIHARVHIRDAEGDYWPPQGHRKVIDKGWREDIGGDVIVEGKTWAYVDPDFILPLPVGIYTMEVRRGMEYKPVTLSFEVAKGEVPKLDIELERWIHMADRGWYSGDTHTHFLDPHTALQEAKGEDLNVINVLASSGGNLITQIHQFTGAPSVVSDDENIVYISEETRHDYLGHTVLLNLKEFVFPFGWGGPHTGVHGGYDYPTMAHQADKVHSQEGTLVAWSHFPHPHGELPIDVALGKVDAVEAVVFGSPFEKHPVRVRMGDLTPSALSPIDLWYSLLNTGFDLPALGSTDKMWNTQVSGSVRTYVDVKGKFTYDSWVEGIRDGRTMLSTGPMLFFSVDGKEVGDNVVRPKGGTYKFEVSLESLLPVEQIEIIVNGEVVETLGNPEGERNLKFSGKLDIDESAWVAARAYSSQLLPTQGHLTGKGSPVMAHTSPIYFEVAGKARTSAISAAYLIEICDKTIKWAKTLARYQSDEQRAEVVALYEKARAVYQAQIDMK